MGMRMQFSMFACNSQQLETQPGLYSVIHNRLTSLSKPNVDIIIHVVITFRKVSI